MSMDTGILEVIPRSCELLGLGEPTHGEPAFGWLRNSLIDELISRGYRSVALETDRVAALRLNDFVCGGKETLDEVLKQGFSHGFGELQTNRRLVERLREHNLARPAAEHVTVYGFDAPTEFASAPSPRLYLEHARNYLDFDAAIADVAGDDDRWSRSEAVMDAHMSPGATPQAETLRVIAHDMLICLYARAPELVPATCLNAWRTVEAHLKAALGLLAYHRQAAQPVDEASRWSALLATRDAIMAQNLLDIRTVEASRGPTMIFAHNRHLQRQRSQWHLGDMDLTWSCAGSIVDSILSGHYTFIAGSLGASSELGLKEPDRGTYEELLDHEIPDWGLVPVQTLAGGRSRDDTSPEQGYFPLDEPTIQSADAIMHINNGDTVSATLERAAPPEAGKHQE